MRIVNGLGQPVQQSLTVNPADYVGLRMDKSVLGVVLSVYPADNPKNYSSFHRTDGRGYLHACTVYVVDDGRGGALILDNVIITPDHPTGLDDYEERLPRACSSLVTGAPLGSQWNNINPYDADGDWCVVNFIGSNIQHPYVVRWWPHPHNPYDAATSGQVNPSDTNSRTLSQSGRYFRRTNGVEMTITKRGDLYLSTYRANSTLKLGTPVTPEDGRFPRSLNETDGGAVKAWIKQSQSFEIDFNDPIDGIGVLDITEDEIPQSNPTQDDSPSRDPKTVTYVLLDKNRFKVMVPQEYNVLSKGKLLLESTGDTTLTVGGDLLSHSAGDTNILSDGVIGLSATQEVTIESRTDLCSIEGTDVHVRSTLRSIEARAAASLVLHSILDTNIASDAVLGLSGAAVTIATATPGSPGAIGLTDAGVTLGDGSGGGVVMGTPLLAAFDTFKIAVLSASGAAAFDVAAWAALYAAVNTLVTELQFAASTKTLVG